MTKPLHFRETGIEMCFTCKYRETNSHLSSSLGEVELHRCALFDFSLTEYTLTEYVCDAYKKKEEEDA